jgi:hypothetical protein
MKPGFLQAAAAGLELPAHFGMNWDALEDVLVDLSWLGDGALLVVFEGAGALAHGAPRDLATLVDVVRAAVEFWSGDGRKVLFLFQGAGRPAGVPRVTMGEASAP